ncbi:phage tail tape measure protein [Paludibacteraceae bacterium OttesenSCG-928-F17]|nr:phage tail tape measure protein [Paludibacteraceae bacterium OttesenSCG-928-F17]
MAANNKALKLGFILSGTDKLSRVVDNAVKNSTNKLSAFERNSSKISQSMLKSGTLLMGAGTAIGAASFGIAKSTAAYGDSVYKNSQALGLSTDQYQKLGYAAKMSAVEETTLNMSMAKLGKRISDVAGGNKTAGKTFEDLGIKLKDQNGKVRASNDVFADLANIFESVADGPTKTALAMDLFGESGTKLIPLLNNGAKGLEALGEEAARMGLVLSEDVARSSEKFNDDMARVGHSIRGVSYQFGTALMPAINRGIEKINAITGKVIAWISENPKLVNTIAKITLGLSALLIGLGSVAVMIGSVTFIVGKFGAVFRSVNSIIKVGTTLFAAAKNSMILFRVQYAALVVWQKLAAAAQWLFNSALLACPAVWIVAAIAAIGTAAYFLIKHWDKVTAFFTKLWDRIKNIFSTAWDWIKNIFLNYTPYGLIIKNWDSISDWFTGLWERVKGIFSAGWEAIKKVFFNYTPTGLLFKHWDAISGWFTSLWDRVKSIFSRAWDGIKNIFFNYTPTGLLFKYWSNIAGWFTSLWDRVKNTFISAWEGIKNIFTSLNPVEWISGIWENVGNFFTGLKERFTEWGKNIIQGLLDGIKSMASKPLESIKKIGENVANKFKSVLGINSPSRLFMEYGVNITEGLTGGIVKSENKVTGATESLALSATQGINQSMQAQTESGTNISNINGGSVSVVYSPTVNIGGGATEEEKQDFVKLLRSHSGEIMELIERHIRNKTRLSFN